MICYHENNFVICDELSFQCFSSDVYIPYQNDNVALWNNPLCQCSTLVNNLWYDIYGMNANQIISPLCKHVMSKALTVEYLIDCRFFLLMRINMNISCSFFSLICINYKKRVSSNICLTSYVVWVLFCFVNTEWLLVRSTQPLTVRR